MNEGRVIGYSAYETYVKQVLSEDPTAIPATEKEWLQSTLAFGASMLLRVGVDAIEGPHYRDISFPQNTRLVAANIIFGDFFAGRGRPSPDTAKCNPGNADTHWCTEVDDYGYLLPNTDLQQPNGTQGPDVITSPIDIPNTTVNRTFKEWEEVSLADSTTQNEMREYAKVIDGLVIQPGTWDNKSLPGSKLLDPNFTQDWPSSENNQYPRLRLFLTDKIDRPFYIILSGFTIKSIIHGVVHTKSTGILTDPYFPSPENGAFLGPSEWPWAAKVVFSIPNGYLNYYYTDSYRRQLRPTTIPGNSSDGFNAADPLYAASNPALVPPDRLSVPVGQVTLDQRVVLNPVIDMENTDPATYYARLHSQRSASSEALLANASRIRLNVVKVTPKNDGGTDGVAVFTTYQRSEKLPPALFGTKVVKAGIFADQSLNPIDTVAPGTLKVFHGHVKDKMGTNSSNDTSTGTGNAISHNYDQPLDKARELELIPENRALLRKSSNYTWHQLDGNSLSNNLSGEPTVSSTDLKKSVRNFTDYVPNIQAGQREVIPVAETYHNQQNSGGNITSGFPGLNYAQPATTTDSFMNNEFVVNGIFQNDWKSADIVAGRPQVVRITTGKQSKIVLSMEDATGTPFKTSGQNSATSYRQRLNVTGRSEVTEAKQDGLVWQDNLSWDHILQALSNNQRIDMIGDELKWIRDKLPNITTRGYLRILGSGNNVSGADNYVRGESQGGSRSYNYLVQNTVIGTSDRVDRSARLTVDGLTQINGEEDVTGNLTVGTNRSANRSAGGSPDFGSSITAQGLISGQLLESREKYIVVGGLRLYVASSAPSGARNNDIGVGWTA